MWSLMHEQTFLCYKDLSTLKNIQMQFISHHYKLVVRYRMPTSGGAKDEFGHSVVSVASQCLHLTGKV